MPVIISMFIYWIRSQFAANTKSHEDIKALVRKHDKESKKSTRAIHRRIDWLVAQFAGGSAPTFNDDDDDDDHDNDLHMR